MPGLLDFLSSPEAQMGMGLLAASGPRTDPNQTGFGQRLTDAMGYAQAQQDMTQKRMMLQQEMRMKQLAEQRAQQQFKNQQDFYNGWNQSTGQGSTPDQAMGGQGGAMPQGNGGGQGAPQGNQLMMLEKAALAGVPGAKELFDIYKYKNDPQELKQGSSYVDRMTGKERFMPKIDAGIGPNGQGGYGALPGYGDAQASIEGAKAAAVARAQAGYDLSTIPQSDGTSRMMPRARAVQELSGQTGYQLPSIGNSQPTAQQMAMIKADIARNGNPNPTLNFNTQQPTLGVTQSPEDATRQAVAKEQALGQAKADIIPTQQRKSAIDSGNYLSSVLDMAIKHPGRETATGLSGTIDPRNYTPGTDAKNFSVVLDQIKGSAFMQAYQTLKGGGQITEVEGKKATDAIARMNTDQSDSEFLKSLNEFKGVVDRANTRMQGGGSGSPSQAANTDTGKTVTLSDIQATARSSGKSTAEVTKALRDRGYTIGGQ